MEKKLKGHLISKVDPGSIGEELETVSLRSTEIP